MQVCMLITRLAKKLQTIIYWLSVIISTDCEKHNTENALLCDTIQNKEQCTEEYCKVCTCKMSVYEVKLYLCNLLQ